jgi:hypothetical protein
MTRRFVDGGDATRHAGLLRVVAKALEPPDLHRTDSLPRHAPWGAVVIARVVTYIAWALSVALVILVIGATVLAVGMVAGRAGPPRGVGSLLHPSQSFGDTFHGNRAAAQRCQFPVVQSPQLAGECAHAPRPPLGHQRSSLGRCAKPYDAPVVLIRLPRHEPASLERAHEAGHGRRTHLLRRGELAEGERAGEDDDGERREARPTEAGPGILTPQTPEEVNCRRVQTVGQLGHGIGRRDRRCWAARSCATRGHAT